MLSHLINKCRRKVLLEYFEEDVSVDVMQSCCDVCEMSKAGEMVDCQEEISIILKTVQEIPESGERKVSVKHDIVKLQYYNFLLLLDFRVDSWVQ